jgi:hypothetical protein
MTPDDPLPDLEDRLAALHAMGPMEFEPGERELITAAIQDLDRISKQAMQTLGIRFMTGAGHADREAR